MSKDYRLIHEERLQKWPGRFIRYWPQILAIVADIIAVSLLICSVYSNNDKTTLELFYAIELSAFSIFLLAYVIIQEYRYSRKARYAEAMYGIHSCIHFLRDYHYDLENLKKEDDCKIALSKVITSFANAFSLITGTHCRGCIKMIETRNITSFEFQKITDAKERAQYLYVNTFSRDNQTAYSMSDEDNSTLYIHPIIGNTDFLDLYLDINLKCFFSNNLSSLKPQNSSLQKGKKLPYNSAIVWPIRKLIYTQDSNKENEDILNRDQDIIGYLCIDSASRNVFRERYDFEIGATIADALYVFLKIYHGSLTN